MRVTVMGLEVGLVGALATWASSCSERSTGPGSQEVLGTEVGGAATGSLQWSSDGQEIYYVRNSNIAGIENSIAAIRVADGAIRSLVVDTADLGSYLEPSVDSARLYYTSQNYLSGLLSLHRLGTDGRGDTLIAAVLSPVGRFVAYYRQDGAALVLNDSSGGRQVIGSGSPLSFSPDGLRLLYLGACAGGSGGLCVVPIAGGAAAALTDTFSLDQEGYARATRWVPGGVERLAFVNGYPWAVFVTNVSSATTTKIWAPASYGSEWILGVTWSRDGARVAVATTLCNPLGGPCPANPNRLYLVDVGSGGSATIVATARSLIGVAFSQDGSRIAYVVGAVATPGLGPIYSQGVR